jgi:Na+-translocating ferredoxin:NAD+ oxidoreductase RNF subunit RnfB
MHSKRVKVKNRKTQKNGFVKPNNLKTDTMIYQTKEWKWCGKDTGGVCEIFVRHKPKDCFKLKKDQDKSNDQSKKPPAKKNPAIVVNEAQFAQLKEEEDFDFHDDNNDDNDKMDIDN